MTQASGQGVPGSGWVPRYLLLANRARVYVCVWCGGVPLTGARAKPKRLRFSRWDEIRPLHDHACRGTARYRQAGRGTKVRRRRRSFAVVVDVVVAFGGDTHQ